MKCIAKITIFRQHKVSTFAQSSQGSPCEIKYNMGFNGFLLVELMIGLLVSTLFMIIITHYIIEVKSVQQKALEKIESFSTERNEAENSAINCTKNLSEK